jgi:hypothetical protein
MRPIALSLLILGLVAALPVNAQIYRWVDDRGVVNYANQRPESTNRAIRIDTQESRLSVIPAPGGRRENAAAPPPASVRAEFPSDVDRATMARADSALQWRARCFAERRVDCMHPTAAAYSSTSLLAPLPAIRAR